MVPLHLHALIIVKEINMKDFAGGASWCYRFMQCNRLSEKWILVCQRLSADFQAKGNSFCKVIEKKVTKHNVLLEACQRRSEDGRNPVRNKTERLKLSYCTKKG